MSFQLLFGVLGLFLVLWVQCVVSGCESTEINLGDKFEPSDSVWDNTRQVLNLYK